MTETKNEAKARRARARREAARAAVAPVVATTAAKVSAAKRMVAELPANVTMGTTPKVKRTTTHHYIRLRVEWSKDVFVSRTWSHSGDKISCAIHPSFTKTYMKDLFKATHLPENGYVYGTWIDKIEEIAKTATTPGHLLDLLAKA